VILPDLNLLVFAYNEKAPRHEAARAWWEGALSARESVALPWAVTLGFVRLMTSRAVLAEPMAPAGAIERVRSWLARPQVRVIEPGPRHLDLVAELAETAGKAGTLTTDLHLAALAIETGAELCSNDSDFQRFPGLRWVNPLR
jgi:uncharacterized protein